jgi:hypothetical protein
VRVLEHNEVEPATAALAACCYADFVAYLLELFANFVELFCGEGAAGALVSRNALGVLERDS